MSLASLTKCTASLALSLLLLASSAQAAPLVYDVTVNQLSDNTFEFGSLGFSAFFSDGQNALGAQPLFILFPSLILRSTNLDTGATAADIFNNDGSDVFQTTLTVLDDTLPDTITITATNPGTTLDGFVTTDPTFPGFSFPSLQFTLPAGGTLTSPLIFVMDQADNGGHGLGTFAFTLTPQAPPGAPELAPGSAWTALTLAAGLLALRRSARRSVA